MQNLKDTPIMLVLITPGPSGADQRATGGINRSVLSSTQQVVEYAKKGWTDWCFVEWPVA